MTAGFEIEKSGKIKYIPPQGFHWHIPQFSTTDSDAACATCDSIKDKEIRELTRENKKLLKLIAFLKSEINSLELKIAVNEKPVSLKKIVDEFISTSEGKDSWQKAWDERAGEWEGLLKQGKISRIKYYRLINGMDQVTLAKKLGTRQPNITRIERPGYKPKVDTLKKLSRVFGVKMEDLIGD